jgi:hypothetical protein
MLSARRRARVQRRLLFLGLCFALYYAVVYRPLVRNVAELDRPLSEAWRELAVRAPDTGPLGADYYEQLHARQESTRAAVAQVEALAGEVQVRLQVDRETGNRMRQPFQLYLFQDARQTRLEALARLAAEAKVGLGPEVAAGFPEFTAGRTRPEMLWPQLLVAHHLVAGAIQSGVSTVAVVQLLPVQWHGRGTNNTDETAEIAARVELSGPAPAVGRFLEQLPLLAEELKARRLPEPAAEKPVMFIQGLVIRKERRDRLDQVRLELTASTLVFPDRPGG